MSENSLKPKARNGWFWNSPELINPNDSLPMLNLPKYNADSGLVLIGPDAWRGILHGLNKSIYNGMPEAETHKESISNKSLEGSATDVHVKEDTVSCAKDHAVKWTADIASSGVELAPVYISDYPPIGYIPHQDLTGWSYVPRRVFNWFHYRSFAKLMGDG